MVTTKTFTVKTKRLIIRALDESDYEMWKKAYSSMLEPKNTWDIANSKKLNLKKSDYKKVLSREKKYRKTEECHGYAIFHKKNGELIGFVSAMDVIRSITHSAFLGYMIFNNHWGQGYAKEAVSAFIELAFKKYKLHRLVAGIEKENKRSILLAKKLAMRKEGTSRNVIFLRGAWRNLDQYALTCEDLNIKWVKP